MVLQVPDSNLYVSKYVLNSENRYKSNSFDRYMYRCMCEYEMLFVVMHSNFKIILLMLRLLNTKTKYVCVYVRIHTYSNICFLLNVFK